MAINPQDSWFKHLIGDVVSRYSDVDMSDFLEDDQIVMEEQVVPKQSSVKPTQEETVEAPPIEQAEIIRQAGNIPPREE